MIEEHVEDFLAYLNTNKSMFFKKRNYHTATQDYIIKSIKLH